jgi:hypothetical protein
MLVSSLQELIKEVRQWRGDIKMKGPGGAYIKVVKSDLLVTLQEGKMWGTHPPFKFQIVNGVGFIENTRISSKRTS